MTSLGAAEKEEARLESFGNWLEVTKIPHTGFFVSFVTLKPRVE